jgi:glycosyltransferase 2 family protein
MVAISMSKVSLAKILVALVAISGLLWFLELDLIYIAAQELDPLLICCVFALMLVGLAIQTEKWHNLLTHCAPDSQRIEALYSLLVGFGFGLFTPGRVGELGRGLVLRGDRSTIALFTLIDRVVSMGMTLLAGSAASVWIWSEDGWFVFGAICGSLVLYAIVVLIAVRVRTPIEKLTQFQSVLVRVPVRTWLHLCLWSLLFNIVFIGQFYLLVGGIYGWSQQVALAIPALFAIKSILPVSFLDIGVREGAAVWIYSQLGYDPLPAFNASLLIFAFNVALPGGIGWILWSRRDTERGLGYERRKGLI